MMNDTPNQSPAEGDDARTLSEDQAAELVDSFADAIRINTARHAEFMGKAMPDDVYERFAKRRDETIPAHRKLLVRLLTSKAQPKGTADRLPALDTLKIVVRDAFRSGASWMLADHEQHGHDFKVWDSVTSHFVEQWVKSENNPLNYPHECGHPTCGCTDGRCLADEANERIAVELRAAAQAPAPAPQLPAGWKIKDNGNGSITVERRAYSSTLWKAGHGGAETLAYEMAALLATQPPAPAPQRLPLAQATAPRKIWLQSSGVEFDMAEPFPENHEGITWCEDEIGDGDVPYIRADLAVQAPAVVDGQ